MKKGHFSLVSDVNWLKNGIHTSIIVRMWKKDIFFLRNSIIYKFSFVEMPYNTYIYTFLALFPIGFTLSWIYGRDRVWRYFVFNDVINLLQGVFIFFVLVCKPSVLSQIWPLSFPDRKKISISQVTQVTISNGNSK